jgi:hypothetical protein
VDSGTAGKNRGGHFVKRLLLLVLTLATGLVAGYVLAFSQMGENDDPIAPGTSISSIADEYILMLSYTSGAGTVTAQRSKRGGEFAVQATYALDRPTQRCTASPDLAGQLAKFSSFTAKRQMSLDERHEKFPVYVGRLLVQSASEEPDEPMMVFTNKSRTSVAFIFYGHATEMTIPLSAFKTLEAGCAEFARN